MAMKNYLNILQWNCWGIFLKKCLLEKMWNKFDIILLNETWIKSQFRFLLMGFSVARKESTLFHPPGQAKSAIYLTIVSSNLKLIALCSVIEDKMGSDHFPLKIDIGIRFKYHQFCSHKYNFKSFLSSLLKEDNLPKLQCPYYIPNLY